jgi:hypothetical protein
VDGLGLGQMFASNVRIGDTQQTFDLLFQPQSLMWIA